MFKQIRLDNETVIYKGKYNGNYSKNEFLEIIKLNDSLVTPLVGGESVPVEVESYILHSVNNQVKQFLTEITGREFINYSQNFWVYTQRKGYDLTWMHQHIIVHPAERSIIKTDYTFTFYVQTTDEISEDQGKIVFETKNGEQHGYLPEEMDIFIFPADLRHTAIPTPNSEKERIVYAGSLCFNIMEQKQYTPKLV